MVVSHHAKFQLTTKTGSRFFRTVFVEILRPLLQALVPEAGLELAEVTLEAHLEPSQASFHGKFNCCRGKISCQLFAVRP